LVLGQGAQSWSALSTHHPGCRKWVNIKTQKIIGNTSAAKFMPSENLANTFGLKLLHFKNYIEIIANLKDRKRTL
jgi:hypothetical protein